MACTLRWFAVGSRFEFRSLRDQRVPLRIDILLALARALSIPFPFATILAVALDIAVVFTFVAILSLPLTVAVALFFAFPPPPPPPPPPPRLATAPPRSAATSANRASQHSKICAATALGWNARSPCMHTFAARRRCSACGSLVACSSAHCVSAMFYYG